MVANFNKKHIYLRNSYLKFEMDKMSVQNRIFTAYNIEMTTLDYILFNIGTGTDFIHVGKTVF